MKRKTLMDPLYASDIQRSDEQMSLEDVKTYERLRAKVDEEIRKNQICKNIGVDKAIRLIVR